MVMTGTPNGLNGRSNAYDVPATTSCRERPPRMIRPRAGEPPPDAHALEEKTTHTVNLLPVTPRLIGSISMRGPRYHR
jgi:hypothetical protein